LNLIESYEESEVKDKSKAIFLSGMIAEDARTRKWLVEVIQKFCEKGATSPEKAMAVQELGLPPNFERAMKRRLGRSGIFVEVSGKYYFSEERWKQVEAIQVTRGAAYGSRRRVLTLRMVQMVTAVLFVALLLVNISVQSWQIHILSIVLGIIWIVTTVLTIYYLLRIQSRV
jgi:hypothetical protein